MRTIYLALLALISICTGCGDNDAATPQADTFIQFTIGEKEYTYTDFVFFQASASIEDIIVTGGARELLVIKTRE
ncbi:MAG: hypothetical protein AAF734_04415 [Bacteroidota bacterium]